MYNFKKEKLTKFEPNYAYDKNIGKLVGKRVVDIKYYDNGNFDTATVLVFDDGTMLCAQDGEYGEDVLCIIEE